MLIPCNPESKYTTDSKNIEPTVIGPNHETLKKIWKFPRLSGFHALMLTIPGSHASIPVSLVEFFFAQNTHLQLIGMWFLSMGVVFQAPFAINNFNSS